MQATTVRVKETEPRRRVNGFSRPFHPLQLLSWSVLAIFIASFHLLCIPALLHHMLLPVFVVLLWCCTAAVVALAFTCCSRDPSVARSSSSAPAVLPLPSAFSSSSPSGFSRHCHRCDAQFPSDSHHCRQCDKCVLSFDHHCLWLNTCIGGCNYTAFLQLLLSTNALLFTLLAAQALAVWEIRTGGAGGGAWGGEAGGLVTVESLLLLSGALVLCALVPLLHLSALHAWLCYHRLTTFAWIMSSREFAPSKQAGGGEQPSAAEATWHVEKAEKQQPAAARPSSDAAVPA